MSSLTKDASYTEIINEAIKNGWELTYLGFSCYLEPPKESRGDRTYRNETHQVVDYGDGEVFIPNKTLMIAFQSWVS